MVGKLTLKVALERPEAGSNRHLVCEREQRDFNGMGNQRDDHAIAQSNLGKPLCKTCALIQVLQEQIVHGSREQHGQQDDT